MVQSKDNRQSESSYYFHRNEKQYRKKIERSPTVLIDFKPKTAQTSIEYLAIAVRKHDIRQANNDSQ